MPGTRLGRLPHSCRVAIPGTRAINDNHVGSVFYTDLELRYQVKSLGDLQAIGRRGSLERNAQIHDAMTRRYGLGVN
jgi:hypothetical protein